MKKTVVFPKPNSPLSEEESMLLIGILMSGKDELNIPIDEIDKDSEFYEQIKPQLNEFEVQVFLKRLEVLTSLKMTMGALAMFAQRFNTVADVVMYAFYLHLKLEPNSVVDLEVYTTKLFPFGMFSAEQMREIWESQKVIKEDMKGFSCYGAPDNLLDYKEIWEK